MTKLFSFPIHTYSGYIPQMQDIGYYIIIGIFRDVRYSISLIIRFELSQPDFQFLQGNYQLYNVVITAFTHYQ